MLNFSRNYKLRNHYLQSDQVPTQSVIKKTMSPALADVYFKSMSPRLKVLAGLEPPLKGGGGNWIVSPAELLKGRAVLKPLKKKYIKKLNSDGVDELGFHVVENYHNKMKDEAKRLINVSNSEWRRKTLFAKRTQTQNSTSRGENHNTKYIQTMMSQFSSLYCTTLNKMQDLMLNAAIEKIKQFQEDTILRMKIRYEYLLKQQAARLSHRYLEDLTEISTRIKTECLQNIAANDVAIREQLHDLNLEKHSTIERLRKYLECKKIACQVYVALKEKQQCAKEIEVSKKSCKEEIETMTAIIRLKEFETRLEYQKNIKRRYFNALWLKKVRHIVRKFQAFVLYCLNTLPEHADFFINMEKLMLIQLNETLENPSAESIFVPDMNTFHTPLAKPQPFYLFCDKSYKPEVNPDLCPKHCTSSASRLPVIVINKKFIYSVCDNFEQFADKIRQYIYGNSGVATELADNHDYTKNIPVKCTASKQLQELKLESSLLQVLNQEIASLVSLSDVCRVCKIPHCFCSTLSNSSATSKMMSLDLEMETEKQFSLPSIFSPGRSISSQDAREHQKGPNWTSYLRYVEAKSCDCPKTAKKHLLENLPVYMRNSCYYDAPKLPTYETCSVLTLKSLVRDANRKRGIISRPTAVTPNFTPKTKNVATQFSDEEFDHLCTCFSDDELNVFLKDLCNSFKAYPTNPKEQNFHIVDASLSPSYLTKEKRLFAAERAQSLRNLINQFSGIIEIFKRK